MYSVLEEEKEFFIYYQWNISVHLGCFQFAMASVDRWHVKRKSTSSLVCCMNHNGRYST